MQKHLDRIALLTDNPGALVPITGLPITKVNIRSALVTDDTTPMQFSQKVKALLDVVVDYGTLEKVLWS